MLLLAFLLVQALVYGEAIYTSDFTEIALTEQSIHHSGRLLLRSQFSTCQLYREPCCPNDHIQDSPAPNPFMPRACGTQYADDFARKQYQCCEGVHCTFTKHSPSDKGRWECDLAWVDEKDRPANAIIFQVPRDGEYIGQAAHHFEWDD